MSKLRALVPLLTLAGLVAAGWALWRHAPEDAAGFVEVKRGFAAFDPRDVIRLNDVTVLRAVGGANADGSASVVVRQKVGEVRLDYARGEVARTLCTVPVRKNRIVTATLSQTRTGITCTVKA